MPMTTAKATIAANAIKIGFAALDSVVMKYGFISIYTKNAYVTGNQSETWKRLADKPSGFVMGRKNRADRARIPARVLPHDLYKQIGSQPGFEPCPQSGRASCRERGCPYV